VNAPADDHTHAHHQVNWTKFSNFIFSFVHGDGGLIAADAELNKSAMGIGETPEDYCTIFVAILRRTRWCEGYDENQAVIRTFQQGFTPRIIVGLGGRDFDSLEEVRESASNIFHSLCGCTPEIYLMLEKTSHDLCRKGRTTEESSP
jgi:hypothetical protein